jgi:hypothetical protein
MRNLSSFVLLGGAVFSVISLIGVESAAQSPEKLAAINEKVVGKWIAKDNKSYIVFFPDGACATGSKSNNGKWQIEKDKIGGWQVGNEFSCGSGALDLTGPNTITRDYGMGGTPEIFHRVLTRQTGKVSNSH